MATLTIRNRDNLQLAVNPAISLLTLFGQNGVDIPNRCGGHARCGFCRITFLSGEKHAAPMNDFERAFRTTHALPPGVRLACQTHLGGDATILIGMPRPENDGATTPA
jgi:ferredoxin